MGYQECYKETNELAAERYELVAERIAEIAEAAQAPEPFAEYFRTNAAYLQSLRALYEKGKSGSLAARSMEECEADNEALYGEILPEAYGHSYANPAYAAARLGETFGGALSLLAAHLRTACGEVFRGNLVQLTIAMELFVEVYNCFEGAAADALPQEKEVQQIVYWYFHDYREIFDERSVRRLVNPAEDFEKEIVMQADLSDLRYLYRYGAYIGENERQIAAYLNTLPEADIQAMADTYTEGYQIGFETTGKDLSKKTALFLIMSDTDSTFNFLISMIYSQLFNLLCEKADDVYGGRLPVHVRCLIDEAANIGQIPRLEKLVATIRSREISCCLVLQAQSQLKALYKDSADTIVGNMDCSIFLGGKEPGTLKELAAALGKETIDSYNTGESRGREVSHSLNYQKLGKELMSVDELAVLDGGKCILQLRGVRPFLSNKYDLTKHPLYRYTADYDKKYAFDIERFLSHRLKLKPDDAVEVYQADLSGEPVA